MNISIYICYNKKTDLIPNSLFKYINCGAAVNGEENYIPGTLRDDTGENISGLYSNFGECTALYWAWKNDHTSDYIGFLEADRHLNFSKKQDYPENKFDLVEFTCISDEYLKKMCLDDMHIRQRLEGIDVVLSRNNYNQSSSLTVGNDTISQVITVLEKKFPEYGKYTSLTNGILISSCCFVMKKEIFNMYCNFLFSILFTFNEKINNLSHSISEKSAISAVTDFCINIWLQGFEKVHGRKLKKMMLQQTYILYPHTVREVKWVGEGYTTIVMSFDNNYCKYAAVCIQSIIAKTNPGNKYKIYILHKDISETHQQKLNSMFHYNYIDLEFINIGYFFHDMKIYTKFWPQEIYYRLIIPLLFNNFNRVIYIDGDMIVQKDLQDLFNIDIENNAIAGVYDPFIKCYCEQKIILDPEFGSVTQDEYYKKTCDIYANTYINSGLILFDIKKCNELNAVKKSLAIIHKKFLLPDQDIINIVYGSHIKILDVKWNMFHDKNNYEINKKYISDKYYDDYQVACHNPYIIHYADKRKPWIYKSVPFADKFWYYAKYTPYYEELKIQYKNNICRRITGELKNKIFPPNTIRRKIAKSIYIMFKSFKMKSDNT